MLINIITKILSIFLQICIISMMVSCNEINKNDTQSKSPQKENSNKPQKNNAPPPKPISSPSQTITPSPQPISPKTDNRSSTPVIPTKNPSNIIGTYRTKLIDNGKNRVKNISIASKEIDGFTLQPEEIFSFNEIVGKRSSSKGYKKAKVIVDGEVDWGVGGGICQLSSTIYNAAIISGIQIMEKHSHTSDVGYVPSGQDAAVNYGTLDLKFKNSTVFPIIFDVKVDNNEIIATIYKE